SPGSASWGSGPRHRPPNGACSSPRDANTLPRPGGSRPFRAWSSSRWSSCLRDSAASSTRSSVSSQENSMSTIDSAPALLDIRGLSTTYGHGDEAVIAAANIDLALQPGEIVALVGESGSGKSTLSKAIIGLLPESARILDGNIDLAGANL